MKECARFWRDARHGLLETSLPKVLNVTGFGFCTLNLVLCTLYFVLFAEAVRFLLTSGLSSDFSKTSKYQALSTKFRNTQLHNSIVVEST